MTSPDARIPYSIPMRNEYLAEDHAFVEPWLRPIQSSAATTLFKDI